MRPAKGMAISSDATGTDGFASDPAGRLSPPLSTAFIGACLAILIGIVATLIWRWVGHQGSDDTSYVLSGLDWINNFPSVGRSHWALRYPIVLALAGSLRVFGEHFFSVGFVTLGYYAGTNLLFVLFVGRYFGRLPALIWILLINFLPGFIVSGTYVNTDVPELFYVSASLLAYLHYTLTPEPRRRLRWLILAGLAAGLGFMVRETTAALILFYGLLFLLQPGMPRWRFFIMGAAAAGVIALQSLYLGAMTGDLLYRQKISLHHDAVDRGAELQRVQRGGEIIDTEGVFSVNVVLDPILLMFVSQKYGFLFYLALATALYLAVQRFRPLTPQQRRCVGLLYGAAVVWYAFIAFGGSILYLVPRYIMVPAVLVAVPTAWLAARLLTMPGWPRRLTVLGLAAFLVSSLGLLYLENTEPNYQAKRLVELLPQASAPIHVDERLFARSRLEVRFAGLQSKVTKAAPAPGDYVIGQPELVEECERSKYCTVTETMRLYQPRPDWQEIARVDPGRRWLGIALEAAGLRRVVPEPIYRRIDRPHKPLVLYRLPSP